MTVSFSNDMVVLVTGAASGIGAATAKAFLDAGATVVGADIVGCTHAWTSNPRFSSARLDIADEAGWRSVMDDVLSLKGHLDSLVNVAGISVEGSIEDVEADGLMRVLDVNTKGVFVGCRTAIAAMKTLNRPASIINVASANAIKAQSFTSVYAASKAAVLSLTRTTALHCAERGYPIRVNAILPGIVRTPMVERILAQSPDPERTVAELERFHPTRRLLEPSEIAGVAVFLASGMASGIHGAGLSVDCGMTAG